MKKIYTMAGVVAAGLSLSTNINAQQLTNFDFEGAWNDCKPWTFYQSEDKHGELSEYVSGKNPAGWTVSNVSGMVSYYDGSSTGLGATVVGEQVAGFNSASAIKLTNTPNPFNAAQIVPAYITLGTTWSTANPSFGAGGLVISNSDGGSFGGIEFTGRPVGIEFMYKRSRSTAKPEEKSTVVAYLWKGHTTQKNVPAIIYMAGEPIYKDMVDRDRCILGMDMTECQGGEATGDAELIAVINAEITEDASEWTKFSATFDYKSDATPEMLNIIIASGDYFGGASVVGDGNTLIVDDVKLFYTNPQLPNFGFNNWKTACGSSEAFSTGKSGVSPKAGEMRLRPGVEPSDWNGSNVNQKVILEKKESGLVTKGTDGENNYVNLKNTFVGVLGIGSVAPGYITLGTPWVYAVANPMSECDGGTYGGAALTGKPDALAGKYKRVDSNEEDSYIIAYLWNGTFESNVGSASNPDQKRDNVDRAIMGRIQPLESSTGKLVASINHPFRSTKNGDWEEIVLPFNYVEGAGEPEMANVIICAGDYWTRSNLVKETNLLADDIRYIYYSRLKSMTIGGTAVELTDGKYDYDIDAEIPAKEEFVYEILGQSAVATLEIEGNKATVVVTNSDADSDGKLSHTYTFNFKEAAPIYDTLKYPGYLTVDMGTGDISDNAAATIEITPKDDGKCDFLLPDLNLGELGSIGDIALNDVTMTEADGTTTYTGSVKNMVLTLGSGEEQAEIHADVTLNGTINAEGKVDMKIDVLWVDMNMPIAVTFKSEKEAGIDAIENDLNAPVEYYNIQGIRVYNPSNGIFIRRQGNKVEKVVIK